MTMVSRTGLYASVVKDDFKDENQVRVKTLWSSRLTQNFQDFHT